MEDMHVDGGRAAETEAMINHAKQLVAQAKEGVHKASEDIEKIKYLGTKMNAASQQASKDLEIAISAFESANACLESAIEDAKNNNTCFAKIFAKAAIKNAQASLSCVSAVRDFLDLAPLPTTLGPSALAADLGSASVPHGASP